MEINEKLAYCYWEFLAIVKETERLKSKGCCLMTNWPKR